MHTYFLFSLPYEIDRWVIIHHLRYYFDVKHVDVFRPRTAQHRSHSGACKVTLTDDQSVKMDLLSLTPFDVKHIKFEPFDFCIKRWVKPALSKSAHSGYNDADTFDMEPVIVTTTTFDIEPSLSTLELETSPSTNYDTLPPDGKPNLLITTENVTTICESCSVNDWVYNLIESVPPDSTIVHLNASEYDFLKKDYESTRYVCSSLLKALSNPVPGSNVVCLNYLEWKAFLSSSLENLRNAPLL